MSEPSTPETQGLYRDGKLLVLREGAEFPEKCAICNQEDDVELVEFCFERKKVHGLEARLVQSAMTAASDLMSGARYTGPVDADIPLCGRHRKRRIHRAVTAVVLAAASIGFLLIQRAMGVVIVPPGELGFLDIAIYNFIAFGMIFVAFFLICTTLFDHQKLWFSARKFHHQYVWIVGVGREFLEELPKYEKQHLRSKRTDVESQPSRPRDESQLTAEELIRRANLDDE